MFKCKNKKRAGAVWLSHVKLPLASALLILEASLQLSLLGRERNRLVVKRSAQEVCFLPFRSPSPTLPTGERVSSFEIRSRKEVCFLPFYPFTFLPLFNSHFLEQAVGVSPFVHEVDHVAHVYADAAGELRVEPDVARERIPVAVEGETYELALAVEDW